MTLLFLALAVVTNNLLPATTPPPTNRTYYAVYWGVQSGLYTNRIPVMENTNVVTIPALPGIKTYASITSVSLNGTESDFSAETFWTTTNSTVTVAWDGFVAIPATNIYRLFPQSSFSPFAGYSDNSTNPFLTLTNPTGFGQYFRIRIEVLTNN